MQRLKRFFRAKRRALRRRLWAEPTRWANPDAYRFYTDLMEHGFHPDGLIDVLPDHRLIYVGVPKAASSTIKKSLSSLAARHPDGLQAVHRRRESGLLSPSEVGVERFYELAIAPDTLRFSFVRNPYERLVSCWADKFQGRPLVRGDPFVNVYLAYRKAADRTLPHGRTAVLPFPVFVEMAVASCETRIDPHWSLQDDLINMPGITLDLIGKVENFDTDFARVLAHASMDERVAVGQTTMNVSRRSRCRDYFDDALAKRVRRAFEKDFDRFRYPAALPQ
mgnify:CR=1 FL=1